jgi:hypothetical protein
VLLAFLDIAIMVKQTISNGNVRSGNSKTDYTEYSLLDPLLLSIPVATACGFLWLRAIPLV